MDFTRYIHQFLKYKTNVELDSFSMRAHSHVEVSLGYIEKGATTIKVLGQEFKLVKGDVVLIPSETVHICCPEDPKNYKFHMFYFDKQWFQSLFPSLEGQFRTLAFPTSSDGMKLIQSLIDSMSNAEMVEAVVRAIIEGVIERFHLYKEMDDTQLEKMDEVYKHISQLEQLDVSINSLAQSISMNKFSFIRKYARLYGLTPHADIVNRRVQRAVLLLETDLDLASIAQDCGFTDQSHFNKQFKLYSGFSPGAYRTHLLTEFREKD